MESHKRKIEEGKRKANCLIKSLSYASREYIRVLSEKLFFSLHQAAIVPLQNLLARSEILVHFRNSNVYQEVLECLCGVSPPFLSYPRAHQNIFPPFCKKKKKRILFIGLIIFSQFSSFLKVRLRKLT